MSRAWQIQEAFGLENLHIAEREMGELPPGKARVAIRACSLNYRDLLMAKGQYNPRQPLPLIPLSDGVGIVEAVGEGVTRVKVGDRVMGCFAPKWIAGNASRDVIRATLGGPLPGMLAEHRDIDEEGLVHAPAFLSDAEAATLPCAALTAWSALVTLGEVCAGQTILVQGTGGVSMFALQIANILGARAIVTSSSDEKLERAKELGAYETINYKKTEQWGKRALELAPGGVDLVVEVGGAGTIEQSLKAVRPGGTISMIGILSGAASTVTLTQVLMNQIKVQGVLVGHRAGFEAMNRALDLHQIRPIVDRTFSFEDVPEAFNHLASGRHFGKICIQVNER